MSDKTAIEELILTYKAKASIYEDKKIFARSKAKRKNYDLSILLTEQVIHDLKALQAKHKEELKAKDDKLKEAVIEAYLNGFKISGEGWNGEYPYEGANDDTIKDNIEAEQYYESSTKS